MEEAERNCSTEATLDLRMATFGSRAETSRKLNDTQVNYPEAEYGQEASFSGR
jgi:hypothetical protein